MLGHGSAVFLGLGGIPPRQYIAETQKNAPPPARGRGWGVVSLGSGRSGGGAESLHSRHATTSSRVPTSSPARTNPVTHSPFAAFHRSRAAARLASIRRHR